MISRIEVFLRRLKIIFSRSEWTIRLLRLAKLKQPTTEPGLVMVQIDGLSMTQFNRGLQKGKLPFLQKLLSKERYVLHSFYSGLPSNTPAVQAELFYGVKGCVPAFRFLDRRSGHAVKMQDMIYVEEFEKKLKTQGGGLLTGGSSYSNIFTGSAKESHCCWSHMDWEGVLWAINPLVLPFLVILYIDIFVRTLFLVIIEFFLAVFECMRGTLKGRLFFRELELVWQRALVCVFLREFITAGVCMDIMRGLPIIHVNFLGYDEQAHGRGPSSSFAHWSMRGIDDAIKRISHVINESACRHYDLWVYSDHGQGKTIPYFVKYGRTIEEAVQDLFPDIIIQADSLKTRHEATKSRVSLLKQSRVKSSPSDPKSPQDNTKDTANPVLVTAMGPLGHIYVNRTLTIEEIHFYAKKLVSLVRIPLVLTKEGPRILAWTPRGCFVFPDEAPKIFGAQHPFLEEIKEDLLRVCFHPDAGEFVIAGWCEGEEAVSFPLEYGAHAGMSPEETHAFALLPMDAPLEVKDKNYLRPSDLRHSVQHFLNRETFNSLTPEHELPSKGLRMMSYNVHGCVGMDGHVSVDRIARVIARSNPDIIALQELDVGRPRSGRIHQAEMIARKLEMKYLFHPAFRWKDEQYGNAILSRYPMALIKSGSLPQLPYKRAHHEPRGVLWVCVEFLGKQVHVFNTHLSLWPHERTLQVNALLGKEWVQHPDCQGPVILCGDFNILPSSATYRKISSKLQDSQAVLAGHRPRSTWFGHYPVSRLDYVFVNEDFDVASINVPRTNLEKLASDHLPLITELDFAHVQEKI